MAVNEDFESMSEDRFDNYGILSRLFRVEIDEETLKELCDSPQLPVTGNGSFDEGYSSIREYLNSIDDLDKALSDLAVDYAYTFIGYGIDPNSQEAAGSSLLHAAYPYESVYVTGEKILSGEINDEITTLFSSFGFHPSKYRIMANSHIACELEFLQYLVGQEVSNFRNGSAGEIESLRSAEMSFIDNHLLNWIDGLRDAINQRGQTAFYGNLAAMTKGWLEQDRSFLCSELG